MKAGDLSPLAGMLTGEGMTGELMRDGMGGLLPSKIAKSAYERRKEEKDKERNQKAVQGPRRGMKRGGKVKKKSSTSKTKARGVGAATQGVRKAKIR